MKIHLAKVLVKKKYNKPTKNKLPKIKRFFHIQIRMIMSQVSGVYQGRQKHNFQILN